MTKVISKAELADAPKGTVRIVVFGAVFDVDEEYFDSHPGGRDVIVDHSGADASERWGDVRHSKAARRKLNTFRVGTLEGTTAPTGAENPTHIEYLWPDEKAWKAAANKPTDYTMYYAIAAALLAALIYLFLNSQ